MREGVLAAAAAVEISGREMPRSAAEEEEVDYGSASSPKLTEMVRAVLDGFEAHEPFGPNGVLAESTGLSAAGSGLAPAERPPGAVFLIGWWRPLPLGAVGGGTRGGGTGRGR